MGESILYGWLRPEVQITSCDDGDSIHFAHWEVRLPRGTLADKALLSTLTCDAPVQSHTDDAETDGLLALLDAQGCFRRDSLEPCSMRELRRRFDRLRSAWYAAYYAHPLWNRLRTGEASRNELLAWVMHNYHISRVAGASAARCASRPYSRDFHERFVEDTFEEYWHVNSYYFVRHRGLAVQDEDVKRYVPLPGSRAFELLTLQVADRDPLGHLLIAYFQESTAVFIDDCVRFYRSVEQAYALPGFFDPWLAHMRLDIDQGHAGSLAQLFESDQSVDPDQQRAAFRCAYLAYRFLYAALDGVLEQVRQDESLDTRPPEVFVSNRRPTVLTRPTLDWGVLADDLQASAFHAALACLGRTLDHDDVMALGSLCRLMRPKHKGHGVHRTGSMWSEAIRHLLHERAITPQHLASLLRRLDQRCRDYGHSFLTPEVLHAIDRIQIRIGRAVDDQMTLLVDASMAEAFVDLAIREPLLAEEAYTP